MGPNTTTLSREYEARGRNLTKNERRSHEVLVPKQSLGTRGREALLRVGDSGCGEKSRSGVVGGSRASGSSRSQAELGNEKIRGISQADLPGPDAAGTGPV